jgi:hypothetical protein
MLGNCSPVHGPTVPVPTANLPDLDLGPAALGDLPNGNHRERDSMIVNVTPPLRYVQRMLGPMVLTHPNHLRAAHSITNLNTWVKIHHRYTYGAESRESILALAPSLL